MKTSNSGFQILNSPAKPQSSSCTVVVGVARGGTSAVAASLSGLGVYMGDKINPANYEDSKLISTIPKKKQTILLLGNWNNFLSTSREYEELHQHWGFKYPSIHNHLFKINKILKNPRYVFVFRDVFSTSNRKAEIFSSSTQTETMLNNLRLYKKIVKFIKKEQPYSLLVSYEKMLTNTDTYIDTLSRFCDITPNPDTIKYATNLIMPSPEAYESWANNHKLAQDLDATNFRGRVHKADRRTVNGWATNLKNDSPVTVEIYINGILHGRSLCDKKRPRLYETGATNTPNVGFNYSFDDAPPDADAVLKVIISSTNIEILNSGKSLREY